MQRPYTLPMTLAGIHNATIWTGDRARPWATSLAFDDGRISEIDPVFPRPARHVLDANRAFILPGFIDAHLHMLLGGLSLAELNLSSVSSRDAFERAIADRHEQLPPGQWLLAHGWSEENWPGHERPGKSWLRAAGDRPVVARRMDHHACLVNDAVLEKCQHLNEPRGGRIERDQTGEPTGLMVEAAAWELVNPIIPPPTRAQEHAALRQAEDHLLARGVTAVGSMEYSHSVIDVFAPLRDELRITLRIMLLDRTLPLDFTLGETFESSDKLAIIGYKTFIDGTLGSRTARMFADYADNPGNRGTLIELAADGALEEWARTVIAHGYPPMMHAIGDEAAHVALDVIDSIEDEIAARNTSGRHTIRPRIEHAQQIALDDIPRFRGRIASMQPLHRADDMRYAARRLGNDRLAGSFAFRSLLEAGAVLAFGSDWPIVSCDPILGMKAAITGLTLNDDVTCPEQNISTTSALRAYTADAAYSLQTEDMIGTIREGAAADLVVLDRNPFAIGWTVQQPRVKMTIVNGEVVHEA